MPVFFSLSLSCPEGLVQAQQLPAVAHHRVQGRRWGRHAADGGQLRDCSDHAVNQSPWTGLLVRPLMLTSYLFSID